MRLISLLLIICCIHLNAQKEVFEQANTFYEAGKYDEAIQSYESSLKAGFGSDELFYNLGNAYYQKNNLGKSILNYEKALKLSPGFKDAQYNLEIAQSKTKNEIPKLSAFFLMQWFTGIRNLFSSTIWSILFILALLGFVFALSKWILSKDRTQKKRGFIAMFPVLALSILIFILAYSRYQFERFNTEAILIETSAPLKHAPDEVSETILDLYAGLKVKILEELGDWVEIELPDKERGWVLRRQIEVI